MFESAEDYILHRKLANETAMSRQAQATFGDLLTDVRDRVEGYFSNNRRLKGSALRELFEGFDEAVRSRMTVVRSRHDERPPTRARPKSEAFEAMYVVVSNQEADTEQRERIFRLHSLRFLGTRKQVVVQVDALPVAFRKHAATRRHQRGENVDHAVQEIGESLTQWIPLILCSEDPVLDTGANSFSVPAEEGMLLGYFDGSAAVPAGIRYRFNGIGVLRDDVPASPLSPSLYCANTFIGTAEMQPNQTELMQCFATWREAGAERYEDMLDDSLWPDREIAPAAGAGLPEHIVDALGPLFKDGRALRAMGHRVDARVQPGADEEVEAEEDGEAFLPAP